MKALKRLISLSLTAMVLAAVATASRAQEDAMLWKALAGGGHVALMRHALAPGTGDPEYFDLSDCSTQRNLSEQGRAQARNIGRRFREHGIMSARVHSSQWCRCLETAELLGLGTVEPLPILNSFFRDRSRGPEQTTRLREFIRENISGPPLVLVTHQVNITALTGVFPQSGEIVVLRPQGDRLEVLGRIPP